MIIKYNNSIIEITDESDLDLAEFGQKYKTQYPADLGHKLEFKPSSKHGIRVTESGIVKCSTYY